MRRYVVRIYRMPLYVEGNRRKFGGKEYMTEFGLDEYDFGARRLNPSMGIFTTPDPLAGQNPSISPWAYCNGDPVNFIDPTGEEPTEKEAAYMSLYVYDNQNYDILVILNQMGWNLSTYNPGIELNQERNGLKSILFERQKEGETEYAYVFAGTQSIKDGIEDILQLFGLSSQYSSAIHNARTLSNYLRYSQLTFVGHSLGGGLAAAASLATGRSAITFNAAALSPVTSFLQCLGNNSDRIVNYRVTGFRIGSTNLYIGGCWLNNIQDNLGFRPPGKRVELPLEIKDCFDAHHIENIVDYYNKQSK